MADPTPQFAEAIRSGRFRGFLVPTSVLLSICMAAGTGVWAGAKFFYGNLETRIAASETRLASDEAHQADSDKALAEVAKDIAVLKANATNTSARVDEMNRKLDTVIDILLHRDKP